MTPTTIIAAKRDGRRLERSQIDAFVDGVTHGIWTDYQASALLMAIFLNGMDPAETADLTLAMLRSGASANLSTVRVPKVDKHSTGGVGDKVSLVLAPLVAACGVAVPMISGRGLGHTGGTLDKLESIPGFRVQLGLREFERTVAELGLCLIGQTQEIAPADRKLYALRDVTATVESIPLICASILSKKFAEDIDALVLDVKHGAGAFMREPAQAQALAEVMVAIGRQLGKPVRVLLTSMEQPLGRAVGNAVEVVEAIETLKGRGPEDLVEVTLALGVEMLLAAGVCRTAGDASKQLYGALSSGAALRKFRAVVEAQGGDPRCVDDPALLPRSPVHMPLLAPRDGYIQTVEPKEIALALLSLGAGRVRASDSVDPAVGLTDLVKVGQRVRAGEPVAVLHCRGGDGAAQVAERIRSAIEIGDKVMALPGLITGRLA